MVIAFDNYYLRSDGCIKENVFAEVLIGLEQDEYLFVMQLYDGSFYLGQYDCEYIRKTFFEL